MSLGRATFTFSPSSPCHICFLGKKGEKSKFQTPFPPFPPPVLLTVNQKWQFLVYILGSIIFSAPSLKMLVRDLPAGIGEEEQFRGFYQFPWWAGGNTSVLKSRI